MNALPGALTHVDQLQRTCTSVISVEVPYSASVLKAMRGLPLISGRGATVGEVESVTIRGDWLVVVAGVRDLATMCDLALGEYLGIVVKAGSVQLVADDGGEPVTNLFHIRMPNGAIEKRAFASLQPRPARLRDTVSEALDVWKAIHAAGAIPADPDWLMKRQQRPDFASVQPLGARRRKGKRRRVR